MKFFTIIAVIFCGIQYISCKSVDPKTNENSAFEQFYKLVQTAIETVANETEPFFQKFQEDFQKCIQSADETIDTYANATAKQVDDLIGEYVDVLCLSGKQTETIQSINEVRSTIQDCHVNALNELSALQQYIRSFQDSVRILTDDVASKLEDCSLKPDLTQKIACAVNNANLITQVVATIIENTKQIIINVIAELDRIRQTNVQCVSSAEDNVRSNLSKIIQEVSDCISSAIN